MLNVGQRLNGLEVRQWLGTGGQGEVYKVAEGDRLCALKLLNEQHSAASDEVRLRWLVAQELWRASAVLRAAPQRVVRVGERLGYVSDFIEGRSLEAVMRQAASTGVLPWTLLEGLQVAAGIAQGVALCESRGFALGDLAADNLLLVQHRDYLETVLIDFDNFAAPGQPPPRMLGHELYLAPELKGSAGVPTPESDRYALGAELHEVLLLKHPKAARQSSPDVFAQAVAEGRWHEDPMLPQAERSPEGYPAEVLSPNLHRLFRKAQSADPGLRPTAQAWVDALAGVLHETGGAGVYSCDGCRGAFLVDATKTSCPYCGAVFPALGLKFAGRVVPLQQGMCLGRRDLGGSGQVSARHLEVRRIGPEYVVEDVSSSGTWHRARSTWTRLAPRTPVRIGAGEELQLGDVRASVVVVNGARGK